MKPKDQSDESRIAEYQAAQECFIHFDGFAWQVGAILIAGAFVFWGIIASGNDLEPRVLGIACLLISWFMSIWFLYNAHNREIYLRKLERVRELERMLNMEQHRRFKPDNDIEIVYKDYGPGGHDLDYLIYSLTALGGSLIGYAKIGFSPWLLLPVPFWVLVLTWVLVRAKNVIKEIEARESNAVASAV